MKLRLKERMSTVKTNLMDRKPLVAAGVFAGAGAVVGLVFGVALA